VLAHVLRHFKYRGAHPNPKVFYNERCIEWVERTWKKEMLHGWRPYSRQNEYDDRQVLELAKYMVEGFYQDWDCDEGWREWCCPTWHAVIYGFGRALEQGDADVARHWLAEFRDDEDINWRIVGGEVSQ
jgi:hypothetical protein